MTNAYKGDVTLELGGKSYTLKYDWDALAQLRQEFGDEFDEVIGKACASFDPDTLSKAVVIGLKHHHGAVGEDVIRKASPPLMDVIDGVSEALKYAYFGNRDMSDEVPMNRQERRANAKTSSKNPAKRPSKQG